MSFPRRRVYQPRVAFGIKHVAAGRVRADGKAVRDDNGLFLPLATSLFPWWWLWEHEQARGVQNLDLVAPWADEVRVFGEVGGTSWEDRVIDPRQSNYEDIGKAATDYAFGEKGTRTQLTVFAGGTGADPDMVVGKVINIMRGRLEAFSSVEVTNEGKLDKAVERRLCQRLQAEFPGLLVATTNPPAATEEHGWTNADFDLDVASMGTNHSERQEGDEGWRQVRQGGETFEISEVKDNNEPPGFESSGAVLHDPLRLACLRLVGATLGSMVKFCHHTGAGIRSGGAADRARGRAANFWEYDGSAPNRPSLQAAVAAYRACEALVPANVANWRPVKGHWADSPLFADMVWSDNSSSFDHGCVRVYGCYLGGAYLELVLGVRRFVNLTQKTGSFHVKAFDVLDGAPVMERPVADGETFRLEGDPNVWGSAPNQAGSSRAYLVLGMR